MINPKIKPKIKPKTYPNIGLDSAQAHFGGALRPAYERFQKRQTLANGLEVAQAAWALHERLWHDKGCSPADINVFRADLFKACPDLKLTRDWVDTAKHSGLDRKDVELVSITGHEDPGGALVNDGPVAPGGPFRGDRTTPPTCTLTMNCADGKTYAVSDVLKRVVDYWTKELLK
jgi:hypothetical protein